jgi:hypothetical protein
MAKWNVSSRPNNRSEQTKTAFDRQAGADHSRVKKIDSRITLRKQVLRGVQIERKRSETIQPDIDPKDWILHGYVYDEKAKPQSGVHVMLADKSGKLVKQLGRASCDRQGYFRLIAEDVAKLLKANVESGEIRKKITVYAQVFDDKGVVLHRGGQALQPGSGQTDYLEIIIGKGADVRRRRPIKPVNPIRPVKPVRSVKRKVVKPKAIKPAASKTVRGDKKTKAKTTGVKSKKSIKKKALIASVVRHRIMN